MYRDIVSWNRLGKIALLIIFAAIVFYIVYPKYYFYDSQVQGGLIRANKITGKVELYGGIFKGWRVLRKDLGIPNRSKK